MSTDRTSINISIPNGDSSGRKRKSTFLVEDTESMERKRRRNVQDWLRRRFASVHAREHPDEVTGNYFEEALDNGIEQHPDLNSPLYDGRDPTVNSLPNVGSENRTKFENERRDQEQEKQNRLGYMPGFKNTIRPRGPTG
jgi:hypothetical protein